MCFFNKNYLVSTILVLLLFVFNQNLQAKSFLWQVKSPTTTVYLLGSIHLATADIYPLNKEIEIAFSKADNLVLEVDLNPETAFYIGKKIRDEGIYYGKESIYDHIDKKTKILFQEYLQKRRLPLAGLIKFKPGILSMTLTANELHYLGLKEEYGIDYYFAKKARQAKMPILELEGAELQMNMLLNLPNENQFFKYTLLSLESLGNQLAKMIVAWKAGNAKALHRLFYDQTLEQYPDIQEAMKVMVDIRNEKMLKKIQSYLLGDKVNFVVVGAGHLTGDIGLVELLRKAQYRVEQL